MDNLAGCQISHNLPNLLLRREPHMIRLRLVTLLLMLLIPAAFRVDAGEKQTPIDIGSRRELFVDDFLIDKLIGGAERRLHHPTPQDIAIKFDAPWEGSGSSYATVFRDGDLYRMYYRGLQYTVTAGKLVAPHKPVTCYAESRDGIIWKKPELGLFEWDGSKENNIVWKDGRAADNFTPFKDTRPGVPKDQQYKAVAYADQRGRAMAAYVSPDGLRWRLLSEKPVLTVGPDTFDSQNVAFWDEHRSEYRAFFRDKRRAYRTIRTATSKDFFHWSEAEWLEYPDAPRAHLYINQIKPYYRAPHLFIGLPARYAEYRSLELLKDLPDAQARQQRAADRKRYGTAITDTLLMSSRDGQTFHRWNEAFIRPGPERPGTWNYGQLFTAWGLLETPPPIEGMPNELSIYAKEGGWTGTESSLRRYTLRIDGFVSVQAGVPGGELHTKAMMFDGNELSLNIATSAGGHVLVAIHDIDDKLIDGFGIDDCTPIFGDTLDRTVTWKENPDLSKLAGKPVRLRFVLKDADLYSLQFRK